MKLGSIILLVDDNISFRTPFKKLLEASSFTVFEAGDGEEALAVIKSTLPDLAIVDLDMPKMNGIELSKLMKKDYPIIPIIMVTAYAPFYKPADILASGIDAFLQKPLDFKTVLKTIEML